MMLVLPLSAASTVPMTFGLAEIRHILSRSGGQYDPACELQYACIPDT